MATIGPLAKVCRLCGIKEGPFANIFGDDCGLAARISKLIPIKITEWDDLPHKICFRCSAKVADLDEFVEGCLKTQVTFRSRGKSSQGSPNRRAREQWENRLKTMRVSNDSYCDDLIKKALQGLPAFKNAAPVDPFNYDALKAKFGLKEFKIVLEDVENLKYKIKAEPSEDALHSSKIPKSGRVKSKKRKSLSELKLKNAKPPDEFESKTIKHEVESKSAPSDDEGIKNFTLYDVSKVDSIYSCTICKEIFTRKDKIDGHHCAKKELESPYPVGLLFRNLPQSNEAANQVENPQLVCDREKTLAAGKSDEYRVLSNVNSGKIVIKLKNNSKCSHKTIRHKRHKQKSKKANAIRPDVISDSESISRQSLDDEDPLFLFQNIDPMSAYEPSYVLPNDTTVQESQISTTTVANTHSNDKSHFVSKGSLKLFNKKRKKEHSRTSKGVSKNE